MLKQLKGLRAKFLAMITMTTNHLYSLHAVYYTREWKNCKTFQNVVCLLFLYI